MAYSFSSEMGSYKLKIETALNNFFDKKAKETKNYSLVAEQIVEKLREYTMRKAKRLRPLLVIQGARAFKKLSKAEEEMLIRASIGIELAQSFLLIHDDIIDESELRRGKPTLHLTFKDKNYGIKQSICAGDLAFVYSNQILSDLAYPENIQLRFMKRFQEIIETTCHGEMLDISFEKKVITETSEDLILKELKMKTAQYTVAGPLQLGAILAGIETTDKNYIAIGEFGKKLGLAFQIQDDILGVFGTEDKLGKPVTSDLEEGKMTLLLKRTIDNLEIGEEKNFILSSIGHHISKRDLEKIKQIIEKSGALEQTKEYANKLIEEAKFIIEPLPLEDNIKRFLKDLCDYLQKRDF
jgi:geranylgeranyl diphosphate synthase type I